MTLDAATDHDDRSQILAAITSFLSALSNDPPKAHSYILPSSYAVITHAPDDPTITTDHTPAGGDDQAVTTTCTLADLVSRHAAAKGNSTISLAPPTPTIWIGGRLAAAWAHLSITSTSTPLHHDGVAAYTLFKRAEGWLIGGLAERHWPASAEPAVEEVVIETGQPDAMVAPTVELCRLLNAEAWDKVGSLMLLGGGATYARFPHTLIMVGWEDWFGKMRVMLERAKPAYVEQALVEWEARRYGDVGLVWTPFTVAVDGEVRITGWNVFSMLRTGGKVVD